MHVTELEATCKTPSSGRIKEKPVSLFLPRQGKIQSVVRFRYEDFDIHGFAPSKGPMSGGTIVTVRGYNLDIGSKIRVFFDDIECKVLTKQITSNSVTCITGYAMQEKVTDRVRLHIDNAERTLKSSFFYEPDPVSLDIKPLNSFFGGGRVLTIYGQHFSTDSNAHLIVYDENGVASFVFDLSQKKQLHFHHIR
jgi:hypothetical protein